MKKLLLILSGALLTLTSCKKEQLIQEEEQVQTQTHTVRFVGLVNYMQGYCKINGQRVEPYNLITGAPEYQCQSGDKLELKDPGYDIIGYVPGTSQISSITHGLVESYIVVDGEIVRQFYGYGDANLIYFVP